MSNPSNKVEFTVVLYGIVASIPLVKLTDSFNLYNGMLLFAFFVLASDWMEYQLSVENVSYTTEKQISMFALDLAILITWTFSTVLQPQQLQTYFVIIGLFVLLQYTWDHVLLESSSQGLFISANLELVILYGFLLIINLKYTIPQLYLFAVGGLLFVGWKLFIWIDIFKSAQANESIPDI